MSQNFRNEAILEFRSRRCLLRQAKTAAAVAGVVADDRSMSKPWQIALFDNSLGFLKGLAGREDGFRLVFQQSNVVMDCNTHKKWV
jgi:hypothetical protein